MNSFLKQSTASQSRAIGPFLDDTDFKTAETGLTIANTDIKLVVNGAASANKNSGGGTHRVNGVYGVTFDATDTATVGEMLVSVVVAGAAPVFHTFTVVEEAVFDQLFGASAPGAASAAGMTTLLLGVITGTAQTGTLSTTACTSNLTGYANDDLIGRRIVFTGGAADGCASFVTDYASASGLVTFAPALATTPTNGDTFKIV